MTDNLPSNPGIYLLHLQCSLPAVIEAGKLGRLKLEPGTYLYVGSARGPGGLRARLNHHLRPAEHPHWHLDYLRRHCPVSRIWYSTAVGAEECHWATAAQQIRSSQSPFHGFGSSDCQCPTHLFWRQRPPALPTFRNQLKQVAGHHGPIRTLTIDLK